MKKEYRPKGLAEFKYYKGETESPFEHEDVRSRFWWGEMLFAQLDIENIKGYTKDVTEWKKWLKEHKPNQSAHLLQDNTDKQLAVALYIVRLFEKWYPYDGEDLIYEY